MKKLLIEEVRGAIEMLVEFMFPLFEVWGRYYEVGQTSQPLRR